MPDRDADGSASSRRSVPRQSSTAVVITPGSRAWPLPDCGTDCGTEARRAA